MYIKLPLLHINVCVCVYSKKIKYIVILRDTFAHNKCNHIFSFFLFFWGGGRAFILLLNYKPRKICNAANYILLITS